ncbi:IPT/TIG domain-containing protein [Azonexus sp.]|jgi:hypothetical protein|uniref:IPT/TIG domain-containing protein n=1 Tax=Azonexus sp. TaxID=1872668 RepID=UPI002836705F|nr:IPT/TIG domain-containing protein [Azonexus sp.]MDR1995567.1 IPT/TIG domain-containing protein [Azonexus sp.]
MIFNTFAKNSSSRMKGFSRQCLASFCKVLMFYVVSLCAVAQTSVSGTIATHTQWTAENGPYLLNGEVTLEGGASLSIEAGTTVYMASGAGLTVQAGTLQVLGTSERPVAFLSDKTRQGLAGIPGDWKQVTINSGATNTKLEHLLIENGRGIKVRGAKVVMNHVEIRNQLGPAIDSDLVAVLSGVGNKASGNSINAITLPLGEITGSATWGLQGIPYLVDGGVISVGASPKITAVAPNTIQQGETITISVTGQRLDGFSSAVLDNSGLVLTPFAGATSSQINFQLKAGATAPTGPASLRLLVDAGEILFPNAVSVTPPLPVVTSINPATIVAGAGATQVTVIGQNFTAQSVVTINAAELPTQYVSSSELRVTVPNQNQGSTQMLAVKMPDPANVGSYLTSNEISLKVEVPVPPILTIEPTPIAMPPDGKPHEITIRLSKADYQDITLNFSVADASRASVTPASITIPAGQTSAQVNIVPSTAGVTTLYVNSARVQSVSVPLFITADFRGASTSYALPVGVVVGNESEPESFAAFVVGPVVNLAVGPILKSVQPEGLTLGSSQVFTLSGVGIPAGAQMRLVPSAGVTFGEPNVSGDGSQLQFSLSADESAAVGSRRLVITDVAGKEVPFADPARAVVTLTTGQPAIDSIAPLQVAAGNILKLTVRGRNLQGARVEVLPSDGLQVDSQIQVAADGSSLATSILVDATAAKGARVVRIVTPGGDSGAASTAANTFYIVSQVNQEVTPITSSLVGVVVGEDAAKQPSEYGPVASPFVEVLVGAIVHDFMPRIGVVGTETTITVSGQGLDTVTGVGIVPNAGLTLGTPTVAPDGKQLSFTVRIDAEAAIGLRKLVLSSESGPLPLPQGASAGLLIAAPIPEIAAVAPQVVQAGKPTTLVTLRGVNFSNVAGVRLDPPQGLTVTGPYTASPDGQSITFNLTADASAESGRRTVIVMAAGGESSAERQPGNSLEIAREIGSTYAGIISPQVGVLVGEDTGSPTSQDTMLIAPLLGVLVDSVPAPEGMNMLVNAASVSIAVGAAAREITPAGWLQGASGTITIRGFGLDQVTSVTAWPAEGILLGAPLVNANGTELTVPITVAPNAAPSTPTSGRRLHLQSDNGGVIFIDAAKALLGIGVLPTMNSVSPINLEKGKQANLSVRGVNLQGVIRAHFAPGEGITVIGAPVWSQDTYGELLSIPLVVDVLAPTGMRVLRLEVPGGITPAEASPANTVNVLP